MRRFLWLIVAVGLLTAGGFLWVRVDQQSYEALLTEVVDVQGTSQVEAVEIPVGSSPTRIGRILEEQELIVSGSVFQRYVKDTGDARSLMAGTFYVTPAMTIPEIVDVLTGRSQPLEERVTIPEGYTIRQIDALLVDRGLIEAGDFIRCATECAFGWEILTNSSSLEGYLFPDTYNIVPQQFSSEELIDRMVTTFQRRLPEGWEDTLAAQGRTLDEVVIMASIVERESSPWDDRAVVAGILWNRYDAGTLIGADATLLYEKEDPTDPITYADLQADSPYNTRKFKGLPPTAISNPGLSSILGALDPAPTDYWYYLHDSDGQIHYGRTLEEHNQNKALYIR